MKKFSTQFFLVFLCLELPAFLLNAEANSLFINFRKFFAGNTEWQNLKAYQIIGIIENDHNDSLEFVLQRIIPDTLRLQVRFPEEVYAITCITSNTGWIVDPTRKIFSPIDLHPEEIIQMKAKILNLFAFIDENLISEAQLEEISTNDTNTIGFKIIDKQKNQIIYNLKKSTKIDFYKEIKFYGTNFDFRLIPTDFFSYQGIKIPRKIEVISNQSKKTYLSILNISFDPKFEKNLFFYSK